MSIYDDLGLDIKVHETPEVMVVRLSGEIDLSNIGAFEEVLGAIRPTPPRRVEVDVGDLRYLGACAIGVIAVTSRRLQSFGCSLEVSRAKPLVRQELAIVGLDLLLGEPDPKVPF
jgi:anti-anti-sigma factor